MKYQNKVERTEREAINIIFETQREAFEIFEQVVTNKNLPEEYVLELSQRNIELMSNLAEGLEKLSKCITPISEDMEKTAKRLTNAFVVGVVANIAAAFINPLICLPIQAYIAKVSYDYYKAAQYIHYRDEVMETIKCYKDKSEEIKINLKNNQTFLMKRLTEASEKPGLEKVSTEVINSMDKIVLADLLIQDYISSGVLTKGILDSEISETAVKMLQQDLKTDETDLETLLKQAKEKEEKEAIKKEMK